MSTPGAERSGLRALSPWRGPWLVKYAALSAESTAPTVSAESAAPGEPIEEGAPVLPAAMTKRAPVSLESVSTATAIGSVPSLASCEPRLIDTTLAPTSLAAHSMPAMICDSLPDPASLSTLPTERAAPGATPFSLSPSDPAPLPPTVEVTWVPWPLRSATSSPGMKLLVASTRSLRPGWEVSTPVSRTATFTPLPVSPASQALGVPICSLLCAMSASTRPSSQILPMPPHELTFP